MAYAEEIDELIEFEDAQAWRSWLERNHDSRTRAWLLIQKKSSRRPGLRYREAVEEALAFGWIDGKVHRVDELTFAQRYTPRNPSSRWSMSNVERIERLTAEGRMAPAGLALVAEAKHRGVWDLPWGGRAPVEPPPELLAALDAADAQDGFDALPTGSRNGYARWVAHAKLPETRERRALEVAQRALIGKRIGDP